MDSEEHVMLMQQGRGKSPGYAIAYYDTLERRFFPLPSLVCYQTPYDTRSQLTMGRVISPHPDNVEIGYFCYSKKKKDRETIDSVILKSNISKTNIELLNLLFRPMIPQSWLYSSSYSQ